MIPSKAVRGLVALAIAASAFPAAADAAETTVVKFCNQKFSGPGILEADLVCTDPINKRRPAVQIINGGMLDLNGFTIVKGRGRNAVRCHRNCQIRNGTMEMLTRGKSAVRGRRKLTVENVDIIGGWIHGALGRKGVFVFDSTITATRATGVKSARAEILIQNSEISFVGDRGNDFNGIGAQAPRRIQILDSSIHDNARFGALSLERRVIAEGTEFFNNQGRSDRCGIDLACADISSQNRPTLFESTCELSHKRRGVEDPDAVPARDWDLCTLDP